MGVIHSLVILNAQNGGNDGNSCLKMEASLVDLMLISGF